MESEDEKYLYFTAKTPEYGSFAITTNEKEKVIYVHEESSTQPIEKSSSPRNGSIVTNTNQTNETNDNNNTSSKEKKDTPGFEIFFGIIALLSMFCTKKSNK